MRTSRATMSMVTRLTRRSLTGALTLVAGVLVSAGGAGPATAGPATPGYAKAFSCSACHGFAGNSRTDTTPILAGMAPWYFKKAIDDYATGRRPAAEMEPYAKMVKELGLDEVAAYFAAQRREPTPFRGDPAAGARGRTAAAQCSTCHGETGRGNQGAGVPDITGQPPAYLRGQLQKFKTDTRSPGDEALKAAKALIRSLPDGTLDDLAAYYSSLR